MKRVRPRTGREVRESNWDELDVERGGNLSGLLFSFSGEQGKQHGGFCLKWKMRDEGWESPPPHPGGIFGANTLEGSMITWSQHPTEREALCTLPQTPLCPL